MDWKSHLKNMLWFSFVPLHSKLKLYITSSKLLSQVWSDCTEMTPNELISRIHCICPISQHAFVGDKVNLKLTKFQTSECDHPVKIKF